MLLDRTMELRQEVMREGNRIGKGLRARARTQVTQGTSAPYGVF